MFVLRDKRSRITKIVRESLVRWVIPTNHDLEASNPILCWNSHGKVDDGFFLRSK